MKGVFEIYGIKAVAEIPSPPPSFIDIPSVLNRDPSSQEVVDALNDKNVPKVRFKLKVIIKDIAFYYAE